MLGRDLVEEIYLKDRYLVLDLGTYVIPLPRPLSTNFQEPTVFIIPYPIQNIHNGPRPFTCRLRTMIRTVELGEVGHRVARTKGKHFPPQRAIFDSLTRRNHVERRLTRAVGNDQLTVRGGRRVETGGDRAGTRGDVDDTWCRSGRLLEQGGESLYHCCRTGGVGAKGLVELLEET